MSENKTAPSPAVQYLEINQDHAGQRIDNYLLNKLKGVPKSRIYRILRSGEVRVNKGRIKPGYRLQDGDNVRIPPVRMAENHQPIISEQRKTEIQNTIIYEDDDILAINKPAGLAVHAGSGINYGVIDILRAIPKYKGSFLELAHRLDRQTSGCLILCKNREALNQLNHIMSSNQNIEKHYLALTMGHWAQTENKVDKALSKNIMKSGERLVQVDANGKQASSIFTTTEEYTDCSLVDVRLLTGRTHQIRVHAASENHPVAGDEKYGDKNFNRNLKKRGLSRMFLHARNITFELTLNNELRHFNITAPLDSKLRQILDTLRTEHE